MALELQPRIGVEADFGGLADAHVGKVGFLEIGLDIGVQRIDERHRGEPCDHHLAELQHILDQQLLTPLFQPILSLTSGELVGYEALIRGPSDSPLHSPLLLFKSAMTFGLLERLEMLCRKISISALQHQAPGGGQCIHQFIPLGRRAIVRQNSHLAFFGQKLKCIFNASLSFVSDKAKLKAQVTSL